MSGSELRTQNSFYVMLPGKCMWEELSIIMIIIQVSIVSTCLVIFFVSTVQLILENRKEKVVNNLVMSYSLALLYIRNK